MVRVGSKMKNVLLVATAAFLFSACSIKTKRESQAPETGAASAGASSVAVAGKSAAIVVDAKDIALLEKMTKAVEAFVIKNEKMSFTSLCRDKRFDCFIDEQPYPSGKKKVSRTTPPYASGSKMGLQGEKRIQVRFNFYP